MSLNLGSAGPGLHPRTGNVTREAGASQPRARDSKPEENPQLGAQHSALSTRLDWRQTLTFAKNESIASILLKLEQVPSREIAIVAPPHLRVFRNPVSMRLLQRKAEDLGLDITIISDDEMTRQLCAEAGFGCYGEMKDFKRENSRPRAAQEPGVARDVIVSAVAGLALAVLAGFIAFFVLPSASITVVPASTNLALDVPVTADSSITTVDLAAGRIPAKIVTSGDVDGSTIVTATGQRDVPSQPARGFVTLTNRTAQSVLVPKGTVLLAGKIAFTTAADTQVSPSLTIGAATIPGQGSVAVQAVDPGEEGNVRAGAITAIQGELASKLTVINHGALTGGAKKKASYLSAEDQAKAKQALLNQLRQQALDKIHSDIPRNESFLPSPDSDGEGAIEELTYEDSPEQVTGQTRLHMRVLVRGLAFQGDDVNQVVSQTMDGAIRERGGGARLASGPIGIEPPVVVSNGGSSVKLQVHTTARMVAPIDSGQLAGLVRGLSADDARLALLRTPGIGDADVQLWPAWSRKVPSFSWRVRAAVSTPPS